MRLLLLLVAVSRAAFGWGCEGHQAVAWIAKANLTPNAAAHAKELLTANPADPKIMRYCTQGQDDPFIAAATWADDARRSEGTGKWHFMDIPRQVTDGDPVKYCEPVSAKSGNAERKGCVLTAIAYNLAIVRDEHAPALERANALRYVIHFVGDLHQPLHTTDNSDQGGNCDPVALLDSAAISNLHSVWDSGLIEAEFHGKHMGAEKWAATLERKYAAQRAGWMTDDVTAWVWESHAAGVATVYGAMRPQIPLAPESGRTDCNATQQSVYALGIHLDREYLEKSAPVIDQQIARAGFRLAKVLNEIWP